MSKGDIIFKPEIIFSVSGAKDASAINAVLREAEEHMAKALLGSEYNYAAPASGTYSNLMGNMKPLTADDLRCTWEKLRDARDAVSHDEVRGSQAQPIGRTSGRFVETGSWFLFTPDHSSAEGRAVFRNLAIAFEAIAPHIQRRAIDDILREDARKHPAFAKARMSAAMSACEAWGIEAPTVGSVRAMCGQWLHEYERLRGGGKEPHMAAKRYAWHTFGEDARCAYERARSL